MIELITMCAPDIAPETIEQIIQVESNGDPLAININGSTNSKKPKSVAEATRIATEAIKAGYSVDMGLMQINSQNLQWLGIDQSEIKVLFTPCANITAGAAILKESYLRAAQELGPGQQALNAALSAYNTGSFSKGFKNGYLAKYGQAPNNNSILKQALHSPTQVQWNPPADYYSSTKTKGVDMEQDQSPSKENLDEINTLEYKIKHLDTPGMVVELDPEEAEQMGAFEEDAMSLEDAMDASTDPREAE